MKKEELDEGIVKALNAIQGIPKDKDETIKHYRQTIADLNLQLKLSRNQLEQASRNFYSHGYNDAVKQILNFINRHMMKGEK